MSILTELSFSNMNYNQLNSHSFSKLVIPCMIFQTNPVDPSKHSHITILLDVLFLSFGTVVNFDYCLVDLFA